MAKKTENGQEFSSSAYLVVPDPAKPSTWKLRIEESPGKVSKAQLGRAAAALGKGFRGNKVQLSSADRAAAMRKLRSRYRSAGVSGKDLPAVLQAGLSEIAVDGLASSARALLEDGVLKDDVAESVRENLEILSEMYLGGLPAVQDGNLSYQGINNALEVALREYQKDPSTSMDMYPSCCIVATFSDSVIYEFDGKTYQVGYKINGTEAVLEGEPVEVTAEFKPTGSTQQESLALIEARPAGRFKAANLDREQGVIYGTTLITGLSENGKNGKRRYPTPTLKKIAQMAEGLPAYLNHVRSEEAFKPRPVQELMGRHYNVRYEAATDSVKSDLHVAEHQRPLVFSLAEQFGDHIGNSLVSRGQVVMEGDTEVVKDVLALRSADLVSDPASTKGLFESKGSDDEMTIDLLIEAVKQQTPTQEEPMNLAEMIQHLKSNAGDQKLLADHFGMVSKDDHAKVVADVAKLSESVEGMKKEHAAAIDKITVEKVKAETELKEAKAKVDKFEAEEGVRAKTAKLEEAIAGHDLGKKFGKVQGAVSDVFKQTLMEADDKDWSKLLDDRLTSLTGVSGVKLPLSEGKDEGARGGNGQLPEGIHARMAQAFS